MIKVITELEQGSEEWLELRNNYVTGTDAVKLKNGVPIPEILYSKAKATHQRNGFVSSAMKRGHVLEEMSKQIYEKVTNQKVDNVGFVINTEYKNCGYSPDGLVGEKGLIECKSFNEKRHRSNMKFPDSSVYCQIQYGLFVTEREWCDLLLYNPDLELPNEAWHKTRFLPDEELHKKFKENLDKNKRP